MPWRPITSNLPAQPLLRLRADRCLPDAATNRCRFRAIAHQQNAIPFVLSVFTKTDKVSAAAAQANIAAFSGRISAWFEQLPAIFTCSAVTEQGREELLGVIEEEMKAMKISPVAKQKTSAPDTRKNRPDRARPW